MASPSCCIFSSNTRLHMKGLMMDASILGGARPLCKVGDWGEEKGCTRLGDGEICGANIGLPTAGDRGGCRGGSEYILDGGGGDRGAGRDCSLPRTWEGHCNGWWWTTGEIAPTVEYGDTSWPPKLLARMGAWRRSFSLWAAPIWYSGSTAALALPSRRMTMHLSVKSIVPRMQQPLELVTSTPSPVVIPTLALAMSKKSCIRNADKTVMYTC